MANTSAPPESIIEKLAAVEHERWSHWQRYVHENGRLNVDGSLTIPSALVLRWSRQMDTPYEMLSDDEKESDREQVRRYWDVLKEALSSMAE